MFKLINGDSLEVLKTLPENSVDAVVTDPPYGLGKEPDPVEVMKAWTEGGNLKVRGGGFMGKEWDAFIPQPALWKEVYRVLKPGGHLLSFFGTRTYDWGAMAIRFAGFEIRDMISWVYGCLSEDTEILTINGWERYHKDIDKSIVLCYDVNTDNFVFEQPRRKYLYENKHTAYRIKSDFTDQIVSRNHRVLIEREGRTVFRASETLELKENIPFLEDLHDLPETIYNSYEGTSITKQDLLSRVQKRDTGKQEETSCELLDNSTMSSLWEDVSNGKETSGKILFTRMQRKDEGERFTDIQQRESYTMDGRAKEKSQSGYDGGEQSCLEGRGNVFEQEGELSTPENQVCEMSSCFYRNGKEGWLGSRTQINGCNRDRQTIESDGMCSSYKSRCDRQQDSEFDVVSNECRSQTIRARTRYKTTLATIEPIEYNGNVWCVEVSTGAFVARRNGKIFITGNSGFPKSLNIGKAIDKLEGNEREVIGTQTGKGGENLNKLSREGMGDNEGAKGCGAYGMGAKQVNIEIPVTQGNSEWEGYGTALKPAVEPIVLARKPLSEKTIAGNVLKWQTGGINIDGCRVGTEVMPESKRGNAVNTNFGSGGITPERSGRWPANLIHDGSEEVVSLFPETKSGSGDKHSKKKSLFMASVDRERFKGTSIGGDSGSASRFFYCAKASSSERNAGLDDFEKKEKAGSYQFRTDGSLDGKETLPKANNHYILIEGCPDEIRVEIEMFLKKLEG